jgi:hypothetical protein
LSSTRSGRDGDDQGVRHGRGLCSDRGRSDGRPRRFHVW